MYPEQNRIETLIDRLRDLEKRTPAPHERAILETARDALARELRRLGQQLCARDYWRPVRPAQAG